MTAQAPDQLENDHPRVRFGPLQLYGIATGDIESNSGWGEAYAFKTPPSPPEGIRRCSALWRGFVAHFRLGDDGILTLLRYIYPRTASLRSGKTHTVNEILGGDFWLIMKPAFRGPRTYVPFRDGRIIEDRDAWVLAPPRSPR